MFPARMIRLSPFVASIIPGFKQRVNLPVVIDFNRGFSL
jgi:hypothetical protein